ncbi:steroid receptor RNA activator 1 [Epargyreus clarus]|uniref:steroid receptor RNA activator 1 n=1 Tax=Epargyreus clarus TaxID=520877 RepID=UPI003C2FCAF9
MDNSNTPVNTSKVPFDPGWNDPPKLAYNAQQTTPNRPRNFLNKRVAFPLSGAGSSPAPLPVNLPPMPSSILPPPPIPTKPLEEEIQIDSESTLKEVKAIFLERVDSSDGLGTKANDIKRRLEVMEDMWNNEKINKQIQVQMRDLAHAIKEENYSKADDIHKALMVNHVSAVCTWMPGVKQLIYHCLARSELLAIDKE